MIRVLIESPYAARYGKTPEERTKEVSRNVAYARRCLIDSLGRGEAPYASHLFYTQVLDDNDPDDRSLGIAAGLTWGEAAEKTAVYADLGISKGMRFGIDAATAKGRPVEYRQIGYHVDCEPCRGEGSFSYGHLGERDCKVCNGKGRHLVTPELGHATDCPSGMDMTLGDQALAVNIPVIDGICTGCCRRVA